jgi:flagellar protein FliS
MSFGINQYRTARVQTASPVGVLIQLYDGAIRFLREAAQHMDEGDIAQKGVKLSKAHRIVSELQATLDREKAPELCDQLDSLYDFVLHQIVEANLKNKVELVEPAVNVMKTLRDAWGEIAEKQS